MSAPRSEDPSAPPVRAVLADRWELLEKLGEGSMGEVWRGRHKVLGHEVAIKLMKRAAAGEQQLIARFLREAQIAARLRHRNIARVEDFGTSPEGRPFLVMELLRGRSLESLLQERKRLDRSLVATIAQHVGAACEVAHSLGVVHRDLKPENCFVVRDEDGAELVKVLDFGVAKVTDGLLVTHHGDQGTASFALLGTPVYMSPEQARGQRDIDHRSDLWSLAVMLYELLLGELPYHSETLAQLLCAVLAQPIAPPSSIDPTLPPSVDAWAARAFDRDRDKRFQSGRELAQQLALCLGEPARSSVAPTAPMAVVPVGVAPTVPEFAAATLSQPHAISQPHAPSYPNALSNTHAPPRTVPMQAATFSQQTFYPTAPPPLPARRPLSVIVLLAAGMLAGAFATVVFILAATSSPSAQPAAQRSPAPAVTPTPVVIPSVPTPAVPHVPVVIDPPPLAPAPLAAPVAPAAAPIAAPVAPVRVAPQRPRPQAFPSPAPMYAPPAPRSGGSSYNPDEP